VGVLRMKRKTMGANEEVEEEAEETVMTASSPQKFCSCKMGANRYSTMEVVAGAVMAPWTKAYQRSLFDLLTRTMRRL